MSSLVFVAVREVTDESAMNHLFTCDALIRSIHTRADDGIRELEI